MRRGHMGTASANRFQRNFMIYVNEDGGFEEGGKPNGHVRLEIRNGKGRLDTVIHNLRDGKGRFRYVLYLIRQSGGRTDYAGSARSGIQQAVPNSNVNLIP